MLCGPLGAVPGTEEDLRSACRRLRVSPGNILRILKLLQIWSHLMRKHLLRLLGVLAPVTVPCGLYQIWHLLFSDVISQIMANSKNTRNVFHVEGSVLVASTAVTSAGTKKYLEQYVKHLVGRGIYTKISHGMSVRCKPTKPNQRQEIFMKWCTFFDLSIPLKIRLRTLY